MALFNTAGKSRNLYLIVLLVFSVINLLWFLETPGWYRYFPAHIVALLAPMAMATVPRRKSPLFAIGALVFLWPDYDQLGYLISKRGAHLYHNPEPRQFATYRTDRWPRADIFFSISRKCGFVSRPAGSSIHSHEPTCQFGEDIFVTGNLPTFLITSDPEHNPYLVENKEAWRALYIVKITVITLGLSGDNI